jgi:hypothetical protein
MPAKRMPRAASGRGPNGPGASRDCARGQGRDSAAPASGLADQARSRSWKRTRATRSATAE